jgi:hypothetical protein
MKLKKFIFFVTLIFSLQFTVNAFCFDFGGALQSLGEGINKAGKELEKGLSELDVNQSCEEVIDQAGDSVMTCEPKEKQTDLQEPKQMKEKDKIQVTKTNKDYITIQRIPKKDEIKQFQKLVVLKKCFADVQIKNKKKCMVREQAAEFWALLRSDDLQNKSPFFIEIIETMKAYPEIGCSWEGETIEMCKRRIKDFFRKFRKLKRSDQINKERLY